MRRLADVLRRVACPTLFIWGGRDPFGGASVGRALVDRIPTAVLDLMAEAGHSPWLDDMAASVSKMTAFLRHDERRSARPDRVAAIA